MSDSRIDRMVPEADHPASRILSTARSEEGQARGEGWMVVRAVLLILGGIAIVSYVMMTVARMGS